MEGVVKSEKLTLSVPEAAQIVGVSQSKMYEIVKIKGFPIPRCPLSHHRRGSCP